MPYSACPSSQPPPEPITDGLDSVKLFMGHNTRCLQNYRYQTPPIDLAVDGIITA
jgi:hypothetical protein